MRVPILPCVALVLALLPGCSGSVDPTPSTAPAPKPERLGSDGEFLRDGEGRAVLLRGVNARVEGIFDVTFTDGRAPLEPIPPLHPEDCQRMHDLGFDFLRLPISWSGLEPTKGAFDDSYLDKVAAAVKCAGDAGIFVLVDMHQDAYSKEIGEDGAPLWAIQPPPTMLLGGPLTDLGVRRLSTQVKDAFTTFFDPADPAGVRAAFLDAFEHVAERFAEDEAVVGFEVLNEPPLADLLDAFNMEAKARARQVAPKKLVFFEPSSLRNLLDTAPLATTPLTDRDGVYAPHVYTHVFTATDALSTITKDDLRPSVDNAHLEAQSWEAPLVIGEFGIGPADTNANQWVGYELDLMDEYFAGAAFWVWKERSQGSWGLFDYDDSTGEWTERTDFVAAVSRPHAMRVAGTPDGTVWDPSQRTLTLRYHDAVSSQNVLWVGATAVADVSCDGESVASDLTDGALTATCGAAGDAASHSLVAKLP